MKANNGGWEVPKRRNNESLLAHFSPFLFEILTKGYADCILAIRGPARVVSNFVSSFVAPPLYLYPQTFSPFLVVKKVVDE